MSFFSKIRDWFGVKTEITDSPVERLDKVIAEYKSIEEKIEKAQEEYSDNDEAIHLEIQKAEGSDAQSFLDKLNKMTDDYLDLVSKLSVQLKEKKAEKDHIEAELLAKAIQVTAVMNEEEQKEVNVLLKAWEQSGNINDEACDSQVKAVTKAVEVVLNGEILEKSHLERDVDNESGEYEGHYSNVIIKNEKGEILFLKRAQNKVIAPGKYCLPGGHIDAGETIEEAGLRELEEEAGICAKSAYVAGKAKCGDGKWAFYMYAYPDDLVVKLLDEESSGAAWMSEKEWMEADLLFDLKEHISALELKQEINADHVPELTKAESADAFDFLMKGKAASVGEKRIWNGIEYVKTESKKWIKTKSDKDRQKQEKDKTFRHTTEQLVSHAENTSTEQLKKIIADESKPHHVRDSAKRELERREDGNKEKEKLNKLKNQVAQKEAKEKLNKEKEKFKEKKEAAAKKEEEKKPKKIKPDETFSGTMTLLKNTEKAPNMGSRFGQDVEPAGFYATQKESDHLDDHPNYKTFTVDIKKPLVINTTKEGLIDWKRNLSGKYKAKGAKLSKMLMEEGYDSIITTDEHGYTGEIIILNTERLKEVELKKADDFEEGEPLEKAGKHYEHVRVVRDGKVFYQFREVGSDKVEDEIPVGDHITSDLDLKISRYSDKAFLITGETFKNLELLRKLKADVGIGSWNKTLGGWVFPYNAKNTVLSTLISKMPEGTFEETKAKEEATQMKNAVDPGTTLTVDGKEEKVKAVTTVDGEAGYEVKGQTVSETEAGIVPTSTPEETLNNTNEENRFQSGKEFFGKAEGEEPVSEGIEKQNEQSDRLVSVKEFDTRSGEKVKALDYTHIRHMDIQLVDQEGILDKPKPAWCPDINLPVFAGVKNDKFVFDYVKMGEDRYLLALNGFETGPTGWRKTSDHEISNKELRDDLLAGKYSYMDLETASMWGNSNDGYHIKIKDKDYAYSVSDKDKAFTDNDALQNNHHAQYAVVSLDQIVAMQDYYQKFAKAVIARKKEIKTQEVLDRVKTWDDAKIARYYPFDYDKRLSEKQKKKYTKEQWDALSKEEKIAEIPNMKHPAVELPAGKRISQLDDNHMRFTNFEIYKRFVDKSYRTPRDRNSRTYDSTGLDKNIVSEYNEVRDQLQWRKIDLRLQREENDSSYEKGFDTSYGEGGTKNDLLGSHGVKVKLQNGKEIKANHTEQIKDHLTQVYESFGDRSKIAKEVGLKISHSGEKMMFARQALGLYVPSMKSIGVSDNKDHGKFGLTLAHEFAHFIDNYTGNKVGRHYASDNLNSTAGKIANTFRSHLNEKSDSDYLNRTCECFARALEQYHAVRVGGENAIKSQKDLKPYHERPEHVSTENFNKHVKPLIEQFFKENEDLLKAVIDEVNIFA